MIILYQKASIKNGIYLKQEKPSPLLLPGEAMRRTNQKRVTLSDIAQACGVSLSAVSLALSGKPGISLPDKPEHSLNANLSDIVSLQGYTSVIKGSVYRVFLFWKVKSPPPFDFTQFVHIRNQAGEVVAQADFQPLKGEYPTRYWRPGEVVVDVVDIPIPAGVTAGEYRVLAGLYRWDTLERLPVTADTTGENAVELERIRVGTK